MSIIKVTLPYGEIPVTGKQVSFVAPCNCIETTGLQIDGEFYTVVDTLCECVTGIGRRWDTGAIVSVILDVEKKLAYLSGGSSSRGTVITLTVDGWGPSADGKYAQTVAVHGVTGLDTQVVVVDVALSDTDANADQAMISAFALVASHKATPGDGEITFKAAKIPDVNIQINVGVF